MHKIVLVTVAIAFVISAFFLFSTGDVLASPDAQAARQPWVSAEKTLSRVEDFMVVHGQKIKHNLHQKIDNMSLIASIDGTIKPIPFQIDEINEKGEWVLPNVPPYLEKPITKPETDEDEGLLDENDELVFMIRDSGDRIRKKYYPKGAISVDEIMLVDPINYSKSWVYLCSFSGKPPRSVKDYVDYVFPKDRVISSNFELGFSHKVPISWDYISFQGQPNMIDVMKIRFYMKFFGINFDRNETHFNSELSLFKDGPVRVIRRVRSSIQFGKYFRTPSVASESIYYDNAIVIPFRVTIPVSPRPVKRFLDIKVRGGSDMQNVHGWRLKTDVDPRWLNINGKMDETEKSIKGEGATWFALWGPPGAMLTRMVLNRKPDGAMQESPLKTEFFYVDDDLTPDPPEFVPGQSPNIGYWMKGFDEMPRGTFYFYLISYMIKDYQEGLESGYLDIMDNQLKAFVH